MSDPSDKALAQELDALEQRLSKTRTHIHKEMQPKPTSHSSYGMRAGMDLVSGVAVGFAVGYGLDAWLNTTPIFMLICLGFGIAAGVKLLMETAAKAAKAIEEDEQEEDAQKETADHGS